MIEQVIEIFDPEFKGSYPSVNLNTDKIGYFVYKNIPFLYYFRNLNIDYIEDHEKIKILFYASTLFSKKHFPVFCYSPIELASIFIKSKVKLSHQQITTKIKNIIDCKLEIPILYNPYENGYNSKNPELIIKKIRAETEYIDLFRVKRTTFEKQIKILSNSYEFSDFKITNTLFKKYFHLFLNSSRYIHIAIHYYVNAGRLINNFFIEDAAINLNLVLETIITDFMRINFIQNKRVAIETLINNELKINQELYDWYIELYDARNEFLAHVDKGMFTPEERISDPDGYCYDHYEDIGRLILKYIQYKNKSTTVSN